MKSIQFKCKLLTDIVINQSAATVGNQQTLDFIPGSNFLGVVASKYKNYKDEDALLIFHSGKVRFGDAHPASGNARSLRIPAALYYPKGEKLENGTYVHHEITDHSKLHDLILKQCRGSFYIFSEDFSGKKTEVNKSFAIKSAYDRDKRRSADEQMYGYQSIEAGAEFFFEITADDDVPQELLKQIKDDIIGEKKLGRSRSAQYGLVHITKEEFIQPESVKSNGKKNVVYADSRLIFIDDSTGLPTFTPTIKQLGFEQGEICWKESQIRTFQYAPWNYKRQARDTDRCGIEKGSVIVVYSDKAPDQMPKFVGSYQNEGFGKVIINPAFLAAEEGKNGKAKVQLMSGDDKKNDCKNEKTIVNASDVALLRFLKKQKDLNEKTLKVYEQVNVFVENNKKYFQQEVFASQWGQIRNIAMQFKTKDAIEHELFKRTKTKPGATQPLPDAYLTHGVAEKKWNEQRRKDNLEKFVSETDSEMTQFALVNLASEMAKISRRNK